MKIPQQWSGDIEEIGFRDARYRRLPERNQLQIDITDQLLVQVDDACGAPGLRMCH